MKKIISLIVLFVVISQLHAVDPARLEQLRQHLAAKPHYHDISTADLKKLIQEQNVILVDVRTEEFDEGSRLPHAIFLPYNISDTELKKALPSKEAVIVVYCANPSCQMSTHMADRLVREGYTNVYKYAEGLSAWIQEGNPIDKV